MKIDIFAHIMPQKYSEELQKRARVNIPSYSTGDTPLTRIDLRLRLMERYPDVLQVLTVSLPPLEKELVNPDAAVELAMIANDELADLVVKYPDKFVAAAACLPLTDIDASLKEADRAITQLNLRGVQIFTNINGEPLSAPKFRTLYGLMAKHDLPIWIHPWEQPTAAAGNLSDTLIGGLGWPFETTVAMGHLVSSQVFKDHPNIKFITHHCGGMIPFFERRIGMQKRTSMMPEMAERISDFRKFYNDTALYGNTAALMCAYAYSGADHLLFGTDAPLGALPSGYTLETIRSVEEMEVSTIERDKIFKDNAIRLLKLAA